jgi:hypothetical protein
MKILCDANGVSSKLDAVKNVRTIGQSNSSIYHLSPLISYERAISNFRCTRRRNNFKT